MKKSTRNAQLQTTEHIFQDVTARQVPSRGAPWGPSGSTCHAEAGGKGHPGLSPAVLEALPQGSLDEGPAAAAVPDRQLQAPHALEDLLLLLGIEEPARVGHVRHECHVDVHGFPVHQRRQNPLEHSKGGW